MIWVSRHSSVRAHFKKLDKDLHRLGHALGRVRELDVAILDANRFGIDSSQLKRSQKKTQKILSERLSRGERSDLRHLLTMAKKELRGEDPIVFTLARKNLRARLQSQLKRNIDGQFKLHELRVVIKKVRYALEAIGRPTEAIKLLQDVLGDAHDLEFLQTLTGENQKVAAAQRLLNNKALRLVKPTLHFAVRQLGANLSH